MRAYTRRRFLAAVKLGLAALPLFALVRLGHDGVLTPGIFLFGFLAGFVVGFVELFILRTRLPDLPFALHVALKSVIILAVLYIMFALLQTLDVLVAGDTWSDYREAVLNPALLPALLEVLGIIAFLLFFVQLDRLLGPGVLLGYVTGRYHRPRREERIFMFLDMKGSTTLADRLGATRYFALLQDYFHAMSEPILESNAEIYKYVGDEIVLTWSLEDGLEEANCIRVFFRIADEIANRAERFSSQYGVVPEFKAGVHCGHVVSAQMGELKSEIAYSGDVLNTAARIQAQCNEVGHRLIISGDLAERVRLAPPLFASNIGPQLLRGKPDPVDLFAVEHLELSVRA